MIQDGLIALLNDYTAVSDLFGNFLTAVSQKLEIGLKAGHRGGDKVGAKKSSALL